MVFTVIGLLEFGIWNLEFQAVEKPPALGYGPFSRIYCCGAGQIFLSSGSVRVHAPVRLRRRTDTNWSRRHDSKRSFIYSFPRGSRDRDIVVPSLRKRTVRLSRRQNPC